MELQSARLKLREFCQSDVDFLLSLMNEPAFHRYIGDRGIRTQNDAHRYLLEGPLASYQRHGHGLMHVSRRDTDEPVGMCGLLRREGLSGPDIGFAVLKVHEGLGYATEAAQAVLHEAQARLGINEIFGITQPDNQRSIRTLSKLGLQFLERRALSKEGPELNIYHGYLDKGALSPE